MTKERYRFSELERTTYLSCDGSVRANFESWISGMVKEIDGKWGQDRLVDGTTVPGFLTWIKEQNATFTSDGLFQTYIWFNKLTGEVVATATISADNRGVKAQYNLGGEGLWGGVHVRTNLRGSGVGQHICNQLDCMLSWQVIFQKRDLIFHLFTANPSAERIYEALEFRHDSEIEVAGLGSRRLWTKTYSYDSGIW